MPERLVFKRTGRAIERLGWAVALAGLIGGGVLAATDGPIAHQINLATIWLLGTTDQSLTATLSGVICLLPGMILMQLGGKIGGAPSLTDQWISRLTQRRESSSSRRLAVLVCGLIAVLALAAIASFWPELRNQLNP